MTELIKLPPLPAYMRCAPASMHSDLQDYARLAVEQAVAAEREACAQAALDAPIKTARQDQREACAAAIRARGEK